MEEASKREAQRIKNLLDEDIETAFADQKYGFISGALRGNLHPGKEGTDTSDENHRRFS